MAADISEFEILTEEDRRHWAYRYCVLGTAAVGGMAGSALGGMTLPGFVGGMGIGMALCKAVEKPLMQKYLRSDLTMTEQDFVRLIKQVKEGHPNLSRTEIFDLVGQTGKESLRFPARYRV